MAVTRSSFSRTEAQIAIADAQIKAGVLAEIEKLRLSVRRALEEISLINAENYLRSARRALLVLLDLPADQEILLTTRPKPLAVSVSITEAVRQALLRHPESVQRIIQRRQQEIGLARAESANKPTLNLTGNYAENSQGTSLGKALSGFDDARGSDWSVSVGLNWPVFDFGRTDAQVLRAKAALTELALSRRDREARVEVEIKEIIWEIETVGRRQKMVEANIAAAEEAFKIDAIRFAKGLITTYDLASSQSSLSQLRRDLTAGLIDQTLAGLRLQKGMGTLTPEVIAHLD